MDEKMTDEWLEEQFRRAAVLASIDMEACQEKTLLRGFANRVLMSFGRDKTDSALAIPFSRDGREKQ